MSLSTFERELRDVAGDTAPRPFLCNGSPLDCQVFLVGINPATDVPLWRFWSVEHGCDKQAWFQEYLNQKGKCGPTRARIELLLKALAPTRALETNIFQQHTPRESDLAEGHKQTKVFDYLLKRLAPRVVFVYGGSAVSHLQRLTNDRFKYGEFKSVRYQGIAFDVYSGRHLAYQWSYEKVKQLGHDLRVRCHSLANDTGQPETLNSPELMLNC